MNICIFSCTTKSDETQTDLYKSCLEFDHLDVYFKKENTDGLSKSYNNFLYSKEASEYDIVVFCHDDVFIDDLKLKNKLQAATDLGYDIIGLAGCVNPKIIRPALWHLMAGGVNSNNLRGIVNHYQDESRAHHFATNFGPTPSRVAVLDGLFLAVNVGKVKEASWRFNENYIFHHYDIASCLDANSKKLKLGVYPINVIHCSHGLRSFDDNFKNSEDAFMREYSR
jgi:hypothetical protein